MIWQSANLELCVCRLQMHHVSKRWRFAELFVISCFYFVIHCILLTERAAASVGSSPTFPLPQTPPKLGPDLVTKIVTKFRSQEGTSHKYISSWVKLVALHGEEHKFRSVCSDRHSPEDDQSILIKTSSCNLQFFSELITNSIERFSHGVTASCLHFTYISSCNSNIFLFSFEVSYWCGPRVHDNEEEHGYSVNTIRCKQSRSFFEPEPKGLHAGIRIQGLTKVHVRSRHDQTITIILRSR